MGGAQPTHHVEVLDSHPLLVGGAAEIPQFGASAAPGADGGMRLRGRPDDVAQSGRAAHLRERRRHRLRHHALAAPRLVCLCLVRRRDLLAHVERERRELGPLLLAGDALLLRLALELALALLQVLQLHPERAVRVDDVRDLPDALAGGVPARVAVEDLEDLLLAEVAPLDDLLDAGEEAAGACKNSAGRRESAETHAAQRGRTRESGRSAADAKGNPCARRAGRRAKKYPRCLHGAPRMLKL